MGGASGQIATVRNTAAGYDVTYTYTYDKNGNITSVSDGTHTTSYLAQGTVLRVATKTGDTSVF